MAEADTGNHGKSVWPLVLATAGFFVVMLDTTIVNVALPTIGKSLEASVQGLQWVVNAYTISLAALLLGSGGLADNLGAHRVYRASLVLFAVASLGCALSPSLGFLLVCRFIQGVAGACLIPTSMVLSTVGRNTPGQRSIALGWWGAAGGLAAALGPIMGGMLVSATGWRSIFLLNLPICALIFTGSITARVSEPSSSTLKRRPLDAAGQLLSIATIGLISLAITSTGKPETRVYAALFFPLTAISLWLFVRHERRNADGVVDIAAFSNKAFIVNCCIGWILNFALFGELFILSMYLQEALGYSSLDAGWILFPQTCSALIAAPLGGRCAAAWGRKRAIRVGLLAGGFGFLAMNLFVVTHLVAVLAVASFLASFGMAFVMPMVSAQAVDCVTPERKGMASGIINTSRQLGTVCGTAVMGTICATAGLGLGLQISVSLAGLLFLGGAAAATAASGS